MWLIIKKHKSNTDFHIRKIEQRSSPPLFLGYEEIKQIPVKCKKAENGCSWMGTVAMLEDHVTKSCDFTKVPCKYKSIGCTKKVIRKEIKTHEKKRASVHLDLIHCHIRKIEERLSVSKTMKNHSITFRLDGYETKKEYNRTHIETFFTSPGGYQMDLLVGYNGVEEGQGTHISVATSILKTPAYSEFLKGNVKIEILNQLRDGNHFSKTLGLSYIDEVDTQIGSEFKFIRHSSLAYNESTHTQYLANDTLYVRVTVVVDNHRPWLEHV